MGFNIPFHMADEKSINPFLKILLNEMFRPMTSTLKGGDQSTAFFEAIFGKGG
jgi:hypothetical protein